MENARPKLTEYQNTLKFKHEDFPDEKYEFMHPVLRTRSCDVLILPSKSDSNNTKQIAIPVDKSLLEIIPYFQGQLNGSFNWRETKNTNGIVTLEAPEHIGADSIFSYIESLYTSGELSLTKKNCLDIFRLAKFWCDDFAAEQSEQFIKKNLDKAIFKTIIHCPELRLHLEDTIEQFTDHLFENLPNPEVCFKKYQIRKFDGIRSENLKFSNDFSDVKFLHEDNVPKQWRTVFTEPISGDNQTTTMNFKIDCGGKPVPWMNIYSRDAPISEFAI